MIKLLEGECCRSKLTVREGNGNGSEGGYGSSERGTIQALFRLNEVSSYAVSHLGDFKCGNSEKKKHVLDASRIFRCVNESEMQLSFQCVGCFDFSRTPFYVPVYLTCACSVPTCATLDLRRVFRAVTIAQVAVCRWREDAVT